MTHLRLPLAALLTLSACNPYDRATPVVGAPPPPDCKTCSVRPVPTGPLGMPGGGATTQFVPKPPGAVMGPGRAAFLPPRSEPLFPGGPRARKVDVPAHAPTLGPADAPVTVVLYTSYQCPHCARAVEVLRQLAEESPGKVRAALRMAPVPGHDGARLAAEAALVAQEQGKFWDFHAKVATAESAALEGSELEKAASAVGLEMGRYKAAMNNHRLATAVDEDVESLGGSARPVFFVNGRMMPGEQPLELLKAMVEQELKRAEGFAAQGTSPAEMSARLLQQNVETPPEPPPPPAAALAPVPAELKKDALERLSRGNVPSRGDARAPVTLVVFSSFASPYAKNVATTLQKVQSFYGPKVRVVFRSVVLEGMDAYRPAARAALAAHRQGKFWEMHDLLFSRQEALDRDSLLRYAAQLRLDEDRFRADMESDAVAAALESDQKEAASLGVVAVPTVFVNEQPLLGDQLLDSYKEVIDRALGIAPPEKKKDGAAATPEDKAPEPTPEKAEPPQKKRKKK
jgi:protein-disulfide isomerase